MGLIGPAHNKPWLGVPINWGDPLATGLVGCWLFNEGTGNRVYDLSGNGNTGSLVADTHFVPGKFGSCLYFDGTGDYVDLGKKPATSLANTSYSIIAWVRFDNLLSGATGIVTAEQSDPYNFALRTPGAGGYKIEFMHRGVSTTAYEPSGYGIWYQCVAVYTLNTSRDLFIDGVLFAHHTTDVTPITANTDSLYAGVGYTSDSGRNLLGAIDHILIYNRVLSANEVQQLYMTPFRMVARQPIEIWANLSATGTVCWGHDTAIDETNARDLSTWTGTATASGSGDSEILTLDAGEEGISPVWNLGTGTARITLNKYQAGDAASVQYKTGNSVANCDADSWNNYTVPFTSLGYVRVRVYH